MATFTLQGTVLPHPVRRALDGVDAQLDELIYAAFPLPKTG